MKRSPLVSVVVPTFNSERFLENCLKSVRGQSHRNIEIIVVDNYSSDRTRKIAEKYAARIFEASSERAKAKNLGAIVAHGKYLLFVDSDMALESTVIEECSEKAENSPKTSGIIIPERSIGNSFWVKVRDFERDFYSGTEIESPRFFRKDLVLKVGGFDEEFVFFEESTLPQKIEALGHDVKVRTKSVIYHNEDTSYMSNWLRKKYYYGKTAWNYKKRYVNYARKQVSPANRFRLFFRNRRFYCKPSLAFGVVVLKSLEYLFTGLGYLIREERM